MVRKRINTIVVKSTYESSMYVACTALSSTTGKVHGIAQYTNRNSEGDLRTISPIIMHVF